MAEGTYTKPTVTVGNPTKKSDYDNLVGFIAEGEILDGDAGLTFAVTDSGKTARVNAGGAQTVNLPSVDATNIGAKFGVWKLGAGNVTIQAADSDTICDGGAGGTLINSTAGQTWGFVILELATATGWIIRTGVGTWVASAGSTFAFGVASDPNLAQVITDEYTTVATLNTGFPNDDTIPQRSEGDEILSCAITPTNASSTIVIWYKVIGAATVAWSIAILFTSASNDGVDGINTNPSNSGQCGVYSVVAGSTVARTYSIRVGDSTGNNMVMNNLTGANKLGAIEKCSLIVMEILP